MSFRRALYPVVLCLSLPLWAADQVHVEGGVVEGIANADSSVRMFRGIPFAAPPVGELRWKAPRPVVPWNGVRKADQFGSRCMQGAIYGDMIFRDPGISEDCLFLNVWTPARSAREKLPVLVYFYGGGFTAGAGDEPRYDGEHLAKKGILVVTMNYRLGVFGFLSHPELTKESDRNASGNYGLMDQLASLEWVRKNIAAFGGDPKKVTIGGESAGSFSVSAQMASPLAKGLFRGAIGESGAFFPLPVSPTLPARTLAEAEQAGVKFAAAAGADSLAALRAKPAAGILQVGMKNSAGIGPSIDGYFFPESPAAVFQAGKQSRVALLAGWNADEAKMQVLFAKPRPNAESFAKRAETLFHGRAAEFLKLYPAATDEEALKSAEDFASDAFIAYSTWKWVDMQNKTGKSPVYVYRFEQAPATPPGLMVNGIPASEIGARHAGEIEYVFETLDSQKLPWTDTDRKVSSQIATYFCNFVKTLDPNGQGLPKWPAYKAQDRYQVLRIGANTEAGPQIHRDRYEFLDSTGR